MLRLRMRKLRIIHPDVKTSIVYPPSRSASVGMILSARMVGAPHASTPITTITLAPAMSVSRTGDWVGIRPTPLSVTKIHPAIGIPRSMPMPSCASERLAIVNTTRLRCAPSAVRMPISLVRSATVKDMSE